MPIKRRDFLGGALLIGAAPGAARAARPTRYVPLTLLHTNDVHGRIYLPGQAQGLTKIATLVREARAAMPNVLLLDAGDIIHGTPEEKAFGGRSSLSAMNALGYDMATAGNHEFDFGQEVTREAIRFARFPLLSANVLDERTGAAWGGLRPYILRDVDGIRVAVFGLTTPTTVDIQWPRTLAGIRFADPFTAARDLISRLRRDERADVVVALSHLGYAPDLLLAGTVSGIDLILGGHSHTRLAQQVWVGETLVMQTGALGRALGRVDLVVRKTAGEPGRVALVNGRGGRWWGTEGVRAPLGLAYPAGPLIDVTEAVPDDPAVIAAYAPFADELRPHLDEVLTTAVEPLPATDAAQRAVPLGSLLAEAVRAQMKTEIGLVASGQMAPRGLPAGPVQVRDLYALMGAYTRQHLVVARVPGARLRELVERAFGDGVAALQVAGLGVAPEITVGGAPLDPAKRYTVAASAYIIQGYLLGKEGVEIVSEDVRAPTLRDAAIAFLRGHAPLKNPIGKT